MEVQLVLKSVRMIPPRAVLSCQGRAFGFQNRGSGEKKKSELAAVRGPSPQQDTLWSYDPSYRIRPWPSKPVLSLDTDFLRLTFGKLIRGDVGLVC